MTCVAALGEEQLPDGGPVRSVDVYGSQVMVTLRSDTLFLPQVPAGGEWSRSAVNPSGTGRTSARSRGLKTGESDVRAVPRDGARWVGLLHHAGTAAPMSGGYGSMRRFVRDNSLTPAFGVAFLPALAGQAVVGRAEFNQQLVVRGLTPLGFGDYLMSSDFAVDVFENWQSVYLQFFLYSFGTVCLA